MDRIRKISSLFFVVLFAGYYVNTTCFSHTHIINGATITHSHFHKNSHCDTQNGNHTKQNITLIAQISNFDYIDFSCNSVPAPVQLQLHKNKIVEIPNKISTLQFENISLRAPPILM